MQYSTMRISTRAPRRALLHIASSAGTLRLYTKPECPLCDGLKGKLDALKQRAQFMPSSPLAEVNIEVCDITGNASLEDLYSMSVPVLTWVAEGSTGRETTLERPSPRASADQLERHIAKHIDRAV